MAFSASPTMFFLSFCASFVLLSSITSVKTKHKLPGISNFGCLSPTNLHLSFGADLWLLVAGSGLLGAGVVERNSVAILPRRPKTARLSRIVKSVRPHR
ncbi:hypothetical protein BKA81DRAFT_358665 [Phyllosticta paracitricarpa]